MNQSIRATEPAQIISLQIRTDCVIFDPENQQSQFTFDHFLSYSDQDTLEFQHGFSLAKYDYLVNLQFQPCTHNLLFMIPNIKFMFYRMKKNYLPRLKPMVNMNIIQRKDYVVYPTVIFVLPPDFLIK